MSDAGGQLSLDFGRTESTLGSQPARKARRVATVRLVEFAPFPRERRDERWGLGFTLDLSSQGACLRTKEAAPVGSLLRVIVRGVRPVLTRRRMRAWRTPSIMFSTTPATGMSCSSVPPYGRSPPRSDEYVSGSFRTWNTSS